MGLKTMDFNQGSNSASLDLFCQVFYVSKSNMEIMNYLGKENIIYQGVNLSRRFNWKENPTLPWTLKVAAYRIIGTREFPDLIFKK
jgi:hypothetical protein